MKKENLKTLLRECKNHLTSELLPFWLNRCKDNINGGFITHFDANGNDTGEDQKSLITQTRTVYSMSSAHRNGYGDGKCAEFAKHGVRVQAEDDIPVALSRAIALSGDSDLICVAGSLFVVAEAIEQAKRLCLLA